MPAPQLKKFRVAPQVKHFDPTQEHLDRSSGATFTAVPTEITEFFIPAYPHQSSAHLFLLAMCRRTWSEPRAPKWTPLTTAEVSSMAYVTESGANKLLAFLRHEAKVLVARRFDRRVWYSIDYARMRKLKSSKEVR